MSYFSSPAQQECFDIVQDFLTVLELKYLQDDDRPVLLVPFEDGTRLGIGVNMVGDDAPFVVLRSYMVTGANTSTDLYRALLRHNDNLIFGKICVDSDGDIALEHALDGECLDLDELKLAIEAIIVFGAELTNDIISQYGGSPMGNSAR